MQGRPPVRLMKGGACGVQGRPPAVDERGYMRSAGETRQCASGCLWPQCRPRTLSHPPDILLACRMQTSWVCCIPYSSRKREKESA